MTGAGSRPGGGRTPGLRPRRLTEDDAAASVRAPGRTEVVKRRAAAVAATAWAHVRPTRNRSTGYLAIGAVGALIATSVAVGVGAAGSFPHLADVGAWLGSSEKGEAAHANGLTGDVDGKVKLPGMDGHPVSIAQDGRTVLVLDKKTGKVVRIDPSQLTAEQSSSYGATGLQLISGGSYAYVVDPAKGTVQRIDPALTTPLGAPVPLGTSLGTAAVDPQGTLWVPMPDKGTVVPFVNGVKSAEVKVSAAKHDLVLTLADGQPVVTDRTDAVTKVLSTAGTQSTFNLQGGIKGSRPSAILVPAATDSSMVPVLATDSGALALVDIRSGQAISAKVPIEGHALGAPQVLGKKVYIPDSTTGSLLVYDTAASAFEDSVNVTKKSGELDVFVRNGLLWVNDEDNAAAAVVNAAGDVHLIGKYKTDVPTARKKDDKPVEDNVPSAPPRQVPRPDPGTGKPGRRTPDPVPTTNKATPAPAPTTPAPSPSKNCAINWQAGCPQPLAPGTPQAQSGPGSITLSFQPASGLTPKRYTVKGLLSGQTAAPVEVGPSGPFTFQINGGSCDQQYSFTIVAEYAGGAGPKESQPSAPVRPCTAPGAPQGLTISRHSHGADLSWQAPSGADSSVTYTVTWPGGSATTRSTSRSINGLQNSQTYAVSVSSGNAAGSGAAASGTLDLTPPNQTMNIAHNNDNGEPLYGHSSPSLSTGTRNLTIPGNTNPSVTVYCTTTGPSVEHPFTHQTSNVWGRIRYKGVTSYIADVYLDARFNSNVWSCT